MSNLIVKSDFVKYKFYKAPQLEITSVIDFQTKQFPGLRATIQFELDGQPHQLSILDGNPKFRFDDELESVPPNEHAGLVRAVLIEERAFRFAHPELHAMIIDRDRLAVLP